MSYMSMSHEPPSQALPPLSNVSLSIVVEETAAEPVDFWWTQFYFANDKQEYRGPESAGCQSGTLKRFFCDVISDVTPRWLGNLFQLL